MQARMQKPATSFVSPLVANLIGIAIAALVVATLTNTAVPLLGSERAIFVAMLLLAAGVVLGQVSDLAGIRVFAALFAMKWVVGLAFVR